MISEWLELVLIGLAAFVTIASWILEAVLAFCATPSDRLEA